MTKRYTSRLNAELTQQLYELGMPLKVNSEYETDPFTGGEKKKVFPEPPSVAKTLDWLMEKGIFVNFHCSDIDNSWSYDVSSSEDYFVDVDYTNFNEAVTGAMKDAIKLLKDERNRI